MASSSYEHGRYRLKRSGQGDKTAAEMVALFEARVWTGISRSGLHLGMTQGLLATMVADTAPADLRGTCVRVVQPRHRTRPAGGECAGGAAGGLARRRTDLPRRRRAQLPAIVTVLASPAAPRDGATDR